MPTLHTDEAVTFQLPISPLPNKVIASVILLPIVSLAKQHEGHPRLIYKNPPLLYNLLVSMPVD